MRTLFTFVLTLFFFYTSAQTVKGTLKDSENPSLKFHFPKLTNFNAIIAVIVLAKN
ncbi:hypothetical protein [Chryseobacterium indoltheticum]|uniref:Uncharacterized protein n=1 Tax=Chryseobacterium indoltheticum TaxID=254 RepID=A0A381FHP0_9FLAO|nr:hypothetical protein [Chryseobacterium indoltheticum]SUX46065.1 Uncharacterised protein [Chryseobacterium indoltheticum]